MTKTYVQVSYCLSQIHSIVMKSPFLLFENYQSRVSKNYALFIEYVCSAEEKQHYWTELSWADEGQISIDIRLPCFLQVSPYLLSLATDSRQWKMQEWIVVRPFLTCMTLAIRTFTTKFPDEPHELFPNR